MRCGASDDEQNMYPMSIQHFIIKIFVYRNQLRVLHNKESSLSVAKFN